jgi:glycosyltransferase involved in cell wall biosynthesis
MRIINLVDTIDKVNFGIYNAAIATAKVLETQYGVQSEIWAPTETAPVPAPNFDGATLFLLNKTENDHLKVVLKDRSLNPKTDIIVSHGAWQWPSRWGNMLSKMGFSWIYVPHGMLEPWSMSQKRFKKLLYFYLFERNYGLNAQYVRAVGGPEAFNLQTYFKNIALIPNGTDAVALDFAKKPEQVIHFLFMARLHFKKGVMPMVHAWAESDLANNPRYMLTLAGPDDGEKIKLEAFLAKSHVRNIEYVGPKYAENKKKLLQQSHFYVLPSHSEGFPTSVVEAMLNGAVPLISKGCNFPEAFDQNLVIDAAPEIASIKQAFEKAALLKSEDWLLLAKKNRDFILQGYTTQKIAELQYNLYREMGFK